MSPPWKTNLPRIDIQLSGYDKGNVNQQLIVQEFNSIAHYKYAAYEKIYTDASKTITGAGSVVVGPNDILKFKLPKLASIFTAELYAILQALNYSNTLNANKILIVTDSL